MIQTINYLYYFLRFFYEYKNCPNTDTDLAVISIESEKHSAMFNATIMDKSVDTFEQNKHFLSAFFRNFKKHIFCQ